MHTIVDAAKEAGISAVIAADVAVMKYARQIGQEVHLSTQLNISNAEALNCLLYTSIHDIEFFITGNHTSCKFTGIADFADTGFSLFGGYYNNRCV